MYCLIYFSQQANEVGVIYYEYHFTDLETEALEGCVMAPGHVVSGRFKPSPSLSRSCTLNPFSITTAYSLYFKEYREIKGYSNALFPSQTDRDSMT